MTEHWLLNLDTKKYTYIKYNARFISLLNMKILLKQVFTFIVNAQDLSALTDFFYYTTKTRRKK